MKRTTGFTIIPMLLLLAGITSVSAAETFKGYITGNLCVSHSMVCLPEHAKEERIVFITEDGQTTYEIRGVDQKELKEYFTYPVEIEGTVEDGVMNVRKIVRIGKSAAGKLWKGGKPNRPKGQVDSGQDHSGHKH